MGIVIGTFKPTRQGGWEGQIYTLTIDRKIRLVPNDDRIAENAPAYRILMGWQRIGDAWEEHTQGPKARDYLRLRFDDPCFQRIASAALFPDAEGQRAQLVWQRAVD